jgi:hypothetical protein
MYQTVNRKKAQYEQIFNGMEQYGSLSHRRGRGEGRRERGRKPLR